MGAKFAKWRAVIDINERDVPTAFGIRSNAPVLARYAALCQELDIVPIVEPSVLMDSAHDIERCEVVTSRVLDAVFTELDVHRVLFEGTGMIKLFNPLSFKITKTIEEDMVLLRCRFSEPKI